MDERQLAEFLGEVVPPGETLAARASGTIKKFVVGWANVWVVLTDRRLRIVHGKSRKVLFDAALDDQLTVDPKDLAVNNLLWVGFRAADQKLHVGFLATQSTAGHNKVVLNDATAELLGQLAPY